MNEVRELEKKIAFYIENTKKDIIMTEEDEQEYKNNNICRFCEKTLNLVKFEIIVTLLVNTQAQLIANVTLMSRKNKVFLFHLHLIFSVTMIVM